MKVHFNCTIQELKQVQELGDGITLEDFNCTIQELKQAEKKLEELAEADFNCTIQELKPDTVPASRRTTGISIAPYRN